MPFSRCLILPVLLGICSSTIPILAEPPSAASGLLGSPILTSPLPLNDPFPILRLRVAPDQVEAAAKQFDSVALLRMSRDDFESRVRNASREVANSELPSQILEARFSGVLQGSDLIGSAEWVILNSHSNPSALVLDPMRIALDAPTWENGQIAIVGVLGKRFSTGLSLWVPDAGRNLLKTKWSTGGKATNDEISFELTFPPSAATTIDLEFPRDKFPMLSSGDVLLAGPFPIDGEAKRERWRFRLGDRRKLDFVIRSRGRLETAANATGALAAKFELTPGLINANLEYDLRPGRATVGVWRFAIPGGFQITEVLANDLASWRIATSANELLVTLRKPGAGGKLLISGSVSPTVEKTTILPIPRPIGTVVGEEKLELKIHPDLDVQNVDPADYRLSDSLFTVENSHNMTFLGTLRKSGEAAFRRPPTLQITPSRSEIESRETLDWRIEKNAIYLRTHLKLRVIRGPLFQLNLRTPDGMTLDRVAAQPDDILVPMSPDPISASRLRLSLARPITIGQDFELTLTFKGKQLSGSRSSKVAFPQFGVIEAVERTGWMSLSSDSGWTLDVRPSTPPLRLSEVQPIATPSPDALAVFPFRGREPEGTIAIMPTQPNWTSSIETKEEVSGNRLISTSRITLNVTEGVLPFVQIFERGRLNVERSWKLLDNPSHNITASLRTTPGFIDCLPILARPASGFASIFAARAALAGESAGIWSIQFDQPLVGSIVIESVSSSDRIPSSSRNAIDDLVVRGATRVNVTDGAPVRGNGAPPPKLSVEWAFTDVSLLTICSADRTEAVFAGTITKRGGDALPLNLPAGSRWVSGSLCGLRIEKSQCKLTESEEGTHCMLPVPTERDSQRFEVRYLLPREKNRVLWSETSSVPELPTAPIVKRSWALSNQVLPFWLLPREMSTDEAPSSLGSDYRNFRIEGDESTTTLILARVADLLAIALASITTLIGWYVFIGKRKQLISILLLIFSALGICSLFSPLISRISAPALFIAVVFLALKVWWSRKNYAFVSMPSVLAIVSLSIWTSQLAVSADPLARNVVFLLNNDKQTSGQVVLVPTSLLNQLDELRIRPTPRGVLHSAVITGDSEGSLSRFSARFVVENFAERCLIELPLGEARLVRVLVDGKPANPLAGPKNYSVELIGSGRHEIDVVFAVFITRVGVDREIRFELPEIANCRLSFRAPALSSDLRIPSALGAQSLDNGNQVRAELGRTTSVLIKWREGKGSSATVSVREGCVWDVSEKGFELTACYRARVDLGSISRFEFELPPDLEVIRVSVRSLEALSRVSLQGWSDIIEPGRAPRIQVDLSSPAEGQLLLTLGCVSRGAPSRQPILRFPTPINVERSGGIYALRANGVVVDSVARLGMIDFTSDNLLREFGGVPDLQLSNGVPLLAFSPRLGEATNLRHELKPLLRTGVELGTATFETTWRVGPYRAEGEGSVRWSARAAVPMIEFTMPARVIEIRGPDIAEWKQAGGKIQVWPKKPLKEGVFEWAAETTTLPVGHPLPNVLSFEASHPNCHDLRLGLSVVRIRPSDGWALRSDAPNDWIESIAPNPREWLLRTDKPTALPKVLLFRPDAVHPRALGILESTGLTIDYRVAVAIAVEQNRPHHLILDIHKIPPGIEPNLDLPTGIVAHSRPSTADSRSWDLDVGPSNEPIRQFSLGMQLPIQSHLQLPLIECGSGFNQPVQMKWCLVKGKLLKLSSGQLASLAEAEEARQEWPTASRTTDSKMEVWRFADTHSRPAIEIIKEEQKSVSMSQVANRENSEEILESQFEKIENGKFQHEFISIPLWLMAVLFFWRLSRRFPSSTWPEQIGILTALFSYTLGEGIYPGLLTSLICRGIWLIEHIQTRNRS